MKQRGVALVTALLVVALATTAAVAMAWQQQLDIRRTGNLLDGDQAYLYLLGVEDWGARILREDRRENRTDHLQEAWTTVLPPIAVEGGQVAGAIEDLQGRFNLNNLVQDGRVSEPDLEIFRRLLGALSLDPALADPVIDWLDADLEPTIPSGAEDDIYLGLDPPYRAANRPMAHASELRLVAGVDEETWEAIVPYVTALPEATAINVNTAPVPILMSLAEGLTEADAEALAEARGDEGYTSTAAFLDAEVLAERTVPAPSITLASRYFRIDSEVMVGRARLRMQSTLWRGEDGATRVIGRTQGFN